MAPGSDARPARLRSGPWLPESLAVRLPGRLLPAWRHTGGQSPPRVETAITNDQPYVQENVLLRLRLISDQNLERADPELPNTNDFLLQKIEGPTTSSRTGDKGKREIVTDFTLTLTPLRSGDLELPPIKVSGNPDRRKPAGLSGPIEPL